MNSLEWMVRELIMMFEISADKYRRVMPILDEE